MTSSRRAPQTDTSTLGSWDVVVGGGVAGRSAALTQLGVSGGFSAGTEAAAGASR